MCVGTRQQKWWKCGPVRFELASIRASKTRHHRYPLNIIEKAKKGGVFEIHNVLSAKEFLPACKKEV